VEPDRILARRICAERRLHNGGPAEANAHTAAMLTCVTEGRENYTDPGIDSGGLSGKLWELHVYLVRFSSVPSKLSCS